jgi:hypothetical protein
VNEVVVKDAGRDQVAQIGLATELPILDVVSVQPPRTTATRETAAKIPPHHRPALRPRGEPGRAPNGDRFAVGVLLHELEAAVAQEPADRLGADVRAALEGRLSVETRQRVGVDVTNHRGTVTFDLAGKVLRGKFDERSCRALADGSIVTVLIGLIGVSHGVQHVEDDDSVVVGKLTGETQVALLEVQTEELSFTPAARLATAVHAMAARNLLALGDRPSPCLRCQLLLVVGACRLHEDPQLVEREPTIPVSVAQRRQGLEEICDLISRACEHDIVRRSVSQHAMSGAPSWR